MKQQIIFSDVFYEGYLEYDSIKKQWKCNYKAFGRKDRHSVESEGFWFTVHFSQKGEIVSVKSDVENFENDYFKDILSIDTFKTYFQYCKELILDVRNLQLFTPNEFVDFHYDYNEKNGSFRFEESLANYEFTFVPNKGIKTINIEYGKLDPDIPQAKALEEIIQLLGKEQTNLLNEMIKRQLKLRYFF